MPEYNKKSTLRQMTESPVGYDILTRVLGGFGKDVSFITKNSLIGGLKIGTLEKLAGDKLGEGFFDTVIGLLNQAEDMPPVLCTGNFSPEWWKEMVVYQIYPRSFCDSNGDGIGDLPGITSKLDYLAQLGVNAIWLSPVYDSPNDDNGYDIRDYRRIMTEFGTMEDFDILLETAHEKGIKVIMDMVINHTSDEHEWFKKALAGDEKYQNYYIFRDGEPDTPPNNWLSFFSGSAWNYYPEIKKWALHLFSKNQMDLNWDNPQMREDIYSVLNFWLDKGVDGFRLDVINLISKAEGLPDGNDLISQLVGYRGIEHYFFGPHLHEYLRELNEKTFGRCGAFTVGETPGTGMRMNRMLTADFRKELNTVFCFDHLEEAGKNRYDDYRYDLRYMKKVLSEQQLEYGDNCWNVIFFENHDNPRMVSKVNPDPQYREAIAKLIAVVSMTLCGTPFIYQGQELAMINTEFTKDELRDVEAINLLAELCEKGMSEGDALARVNAGSRDHARIPMQWDSQKNAGFTEGEPWIKCADNIGRFNAADETDDENSVFAVYKKLIALKNSSQTLRYGRFEPLKKKADNLFCYFRKTDSECFYIEMNLTDKPCARKHNVKKYEPVYLSCGNIAGKLRPYEANIYRAK